MEGEPGRYVPGDDRGGEHVEQGQRFLRKSTWSLASEALRQRQVPLISNLELDRDRHLRLLTNLPNLGAKVKASVRANGVLLSLVYLDGGWPLG